MNKATVKLWSMKVIQFVLGLVLMMCFLEIGTRVYAHIFSRERLTTADYMLGWKLVPEARSLYGKEIQTYHVAVNSHGQRDREHSYEKTPGVYRILVVGDSMVFGSGGVESSDRFTDILEKSTRNVEVINAGTPGYGTDQEYQFLKMEGLKYHPDLVILCAVFNDFTDSFTTVNPSIGRPKGYFSMSDGRLVYHPPQFSTFYKLAQHSYLLGLLDRVLSRIFIAYRQKYRHPREVLDSQARMATFRQLFISMAELCRQQGSEFLVIYVPFPRQVQKWILQQVMDQVSAAEGIKTFDLTDTVRPLNAAKPAYFRGDVHLNEYGNQVVAKALLEYLANNGLLPAGATQVSGAMQ